MIGCGATLRGEADSDGTDRIVAEGVEIAGLFSKDDLEAGVLGALTTGTELFIVRRLVAPCGAWSPSADLERDASVSVSVLPDAPADVAVLAVSLETEDDVGAFPVLVLPIVLTEGEADSEARGLIATGVFVISCRDTVPPDPSGGSVGFSGR